MGAERIFLGWDRPLVSAAAGWLSEQHGADMSGLVIATPGARAGRRLLEQLARQAAPNWVPPRIVTQGQLTDELVRLPLPAASRLARTLAWERAISQLSSAEWSALTRNNRERAADAMPMAERVRALHGELAPEGLGFAQLAHEDSCTPQEEAGRWRALEKAQAGYRSILGELELCDPHEARFHAIDTGDFDAEVDVILVGVADGNKLLWRLLEKLGERVTALIAAPGEEAEAFDGFGGLLRQAWSDRSVPLALNAWHVVPGPADQAEQVCQVLRRLEQPQSADAITVGVADGEVSPFLSRRLGQEGVGVRDAAGTPLDRTRPMQLLGLVARYLKGLRFEAFAAVVRHPDLGHLWSSNASLFPERDPALVLDDYQRAHLPAKADGEWLSTDSVPTEIENVHASLLALCGELASDEQRPLSAWAVPLRELLTAVYGEQELDPEVEHERVLMEALAAIGEFLSELEALPTGLGPKDLSASRALDFLLRSLRGQALPPSQASVARIELLGWLELALDDAPILIVTGFNEGRVPQSIDSDPFLPDRVREELGLASNEERLARDVYALHVMCHSRRDAHFISGRRTNRGDPIFPSRLAFHCAAEEVAERVRHGLAQGHGASLPLAARALSSAGAGSKPATGPPRLASAPVLEHISVSAFRQYLQSPYLYYLQRHLGLESINDRENELNPLAFGNLAHDILYAFGKSKGRDSTRPDDILKFLLRELDRQARSLYGKDPLPAVRLQLEQLRRRFEVFAELQAQRTSVGWRIAHVEWAPKGGGIPFRVDGQNVQLRGRIDRIDVHAVSGAWAILDYKSGDKGGDPRRAHVDRQGNWKDLQLPLYCLLAESLGHESMPELGYANLSQDSDSSGFVMFNDLDEGLLESALDTAKEVVRRIRKEELYEVGRAKVFDPITSAVCGLNQFLPDEDDGVMEVTVPVS